MPLDITGTWKLLAWKRFEGDTTHYPLGEQVTGILIYAADGSMAVQMTALDRPHIPTSDPQGGTAEERAAAYSTCLAYFGKWSQAPDDDIVTHYVDASLFPNWSETVQHRPFTCDGRYLALRTPPSDGPNGPVVNEMSWERA